MQEPRVEREDGWQTVMQDDLRPAGNGKDCFYCQQPLGALHTTECVIRKLSGWFFVAIRDNDTGEVRRYRQDMSWDDDGTAFDWNENNNSCDCNRHLCFMRANGPGPEDDPHWMNEDRECGDDKYSVLYFEMQTGERIEPYVEQAPLRS